MAEANQTIKKVLNHLNSKIGTGGVVDSWSDGQGNFWRKYADGFIEQGGSIEHPRDSTVTVTLAKEFASGDSYQAFAQSCGHNSNDSNNNSNVVMNKTAQSFDIRSFEAVHTSSWYACGY